MAEARTRAQVLLSTLRGKKRILILTHDNPDPDAIAAGMALQYVIAACLGVQPVLAFGGIIGRAENKALVDALAVELQQASEISFRRYQAVALVDTQPGAGNHSLPPGVTPDVVIDHHHWESSTAGVPFADVRPEYGASATLLVEYLRALKLPIDSRLATALFYGIKVDTQDLGRHASEADVEAYMHLFPLAEKLLLPKIEYPTLPREYFETFHEAWERAQIYDKVVLSALDEVENPNAVAEVADLLLRLEGMAWSACLGFYGDQLFISVRTTDAEANAHEVVRRAMGALGAGGGHEMLAAGRIPAGGLNRAKRLRLRDEVVRRLLCALGVEGKVPEGLLRLVNRPNLGDYLLDRRHLGQ